MLRVVLLALALLGPTNSQAAGGKKEAALNLLRDGNQRFIKMDYEGALLCYRRAYALFPSYKLHFNMARSLQQLGRQTEVAEALERFFEEGGTHMDPELARGARALYESVRAEVSSITVACPEGAVVTVNQGGTRRTARPGRAHYLEPGAFEVVVRLDGHQVYRSRQALVAGEHLRLEPRLLPRRAAAVRPSLPARVPPPPATVAQPSPESEVTTRRKTQTRWGLAALGLTVACLGGAAVLYGVGGTRGTEAHEAYLAAQSQADMDARFAEVEGARRLLVGGHVLTGAAAVAAGVGIYLLFTRPEEPAASGVSLPSLRLGLGPGTGALLLQGVF